jgi:hypothetical protein
VQSVYGLLVTVANLAVITTKVLHIPQCNCILASLKFSGCYHPTHHSFPKICHTGLFAQEWL